MHPLSRFVLRLRQRVLRWYEFGMYALLAGLALAVALPAAPGEVEDEPAQCGKAQSSATVIVR